MLRDPLWDWGSILASLRILGLGELLHLITEWRPSTFVEIDPFGLSILGLLGAALYCGASLPLPRIILVLGLLHMALSHVRNLELFALLLPLAVLTPVASQCGLRAASAVRPRVAPGAAARGVWRKAGGAGKLGAPPYPPILPAFLEITVTDTGIGIPAEHLERIFQEFEQVVDTTLPRQEGTGLGLPLVKKFVELHGGTIRARSTPGSGSAFVFTIPTAP